MRMFLYRLKWRLQNLHGFMDYVWVAFTALNLYGVVSGLLAGNLVGVAISGFLLYVCIHPLLRS